jgi:hypothetical protein
MLWSASSIGAAPEDSLRPSVLGIGQLPGEKRPDLLRPKERNPFSRREAKAVEVTADRESEESRIRAILSSTSVTGIIRGSGEVKALLGSLVLKEGKLVPPLIEGQTERLVVGSITRTAIEINFVEMDDHAEPRKIVVPIDLRPRISVRPPIASQPAGSSPIRPPTP